MCTRVANATLLSHLHSVSHEAKPPDSYGEYQISTDAIEDIMSSPFAGDGSKTPSDHLQMIEERCSLFRIAGIKHEEVERRLFYFYLIGDARNLYHCLKHTDRKIWDYVKRAFYLKYYTPLKAYGDRSLIYNFLPHPGESITQAWGRLKGLLRNNPSHCLSKSTILINLYA